MALLKQTRIVFIGEPDAGKSSLIKAFAEAETGRTVNPDTLMHEVHHSDGLDPDGNPDTRTMKCAKIIIPMDSGEWSLYDAPGHLEYEGEILQGLRSAHLVVHLAREGGAAHAAYAASLCPEARAILKRKPVLHAFSHSSRREPGHYDIGAANFTEFRPQLHDFVRRHGDAGDFEPVDVLAEAVALSAKIVGAARKPLMMFSGGKDSLAGMEILKRAGVLGRVDVVYPRSGYDFPEVEEMVRRYSELYSVPIRAVDNSGGLTYGADGAYAMMQAKAACNNRVLAETGADLACIQYRASDEGVRSKDHHISRREGHSRFSPVFYFSEENVWRLIDMLSLPYCPLYNKGYRSLGDMPVTRPCMPELASAAEIAAYIRKHPETRERDGRTGQDASVPFAMERLRNVGFF